MVLAMADNVESVADEEELRLFTVDERNILFLFLFCWGPGGEGLRGCPSYNDNGSQVLSTRDGSTMVASEP